MRWIALITISAALLMVCAEPDPKKFKSEIKDKDKASNASLTDDERKFLREVEAKFGIKDNLPTEKTKIDIESNINSNDTVKAPFPAVIAIEIVNDTDINTKGKRTIDANLGYGYRTNNGYTYTYFGKPQEKGKFMIYPYSQEDIPPTNPAKYNHGSSSSGVHSTAATSVEIQPSRAYELIDVKEEQNSYHYNKPTPSPHTNYQNIKGLVSPPPPYSSIQTHQEAPQTHPQTLYTTYNGHDFSSLSGQFPSVMSNYLVDSSQLLKNPQYQHAGLNQDYVKTHSSQLAQRVVPVLVLRIPSSFLKQPTAELYSNLPNNYPVSHYLNNVNLQEVVNNYFKKIGYSFAPQVSYQNSLLHESAPTPTVASHESHHYASPHVNPTYSQADNSGVQYSAVQPVMAKYPTVYTRKEQYYVPMMQAYQQPQQQYEYTFQYTPNSENPQAYYVPQYSQAAEASHGAQSEQAAVDQSTGGHAEYGVPQQAAGYETSEPAVEYRTPEIQSQHQSSPAVSYESQAASQEYGTPKEQTVEYTPQQTVAADYDSSKYQLPSYPATQGRSRYVASHELPKETLAIYAQMNQAIANYAASSGLPSYYYQKQSGDDSGANTLVLSENYPSKDHTIATVLPLSYKRDKKPNTSTVQTVSYVTPMPHSKYQSPYKIMVPQTVFRNPSSEKVSYVNSHSLPYSQIVNQEYNPEAEYTVPTQYLPPVGKQKPPSYPRNYHSHPKRNAKPEKSENHSSQIKKRTEKNDHKKSS